MYDYLKTKTELFSVIWNALDDSYFLEFLLSRLTKNKLLKTHVVSWAILFA